MERIALISDLHSNIVATKAVFEDIEERGIKRIFCLGDLVLKGSSPCEVVDLIRKKCEIVLKGNGDDGAVNPQKIKPKEWYTNKLGKDRLDYLNNLPMYKDIYISGSLIRMFHATKNDFNYRITDLAPIEEKLKLFEDEYNVIPDMVIYADIHKQYIQKIKNKTIINIGSVGNSFEMSVIDNKDEKMDEVTQAHYCIIEGELDSKERRPISIQFVRVPYDIDEEIRLAKEKGSPLIDGYILELKKGRYRGKKEIYNGIVFKNSLTNDSILSDFKIENENGEYYTIVVGEDSIKEIVQYLKSKTHMIFWNKKKTIIVFNDKTFEIDKTKSDFEIIFQEAINYGINLGIPKEKICFDMEE